MGSDEVHERVRSLLAGEPSGGRNQQFADYSDREGREVMRLYRLYVSLGKELKEAAGRQDMRVLVRRRNGGLHLEVNDPKVSYRRACQVPPGLVGHFLKLLVQLGPQPWGGKS